MIETPRSLLRESKKNLEMGLLLVILHAALMLNPAPADRPGTFYVEKSGSDEHPGTSKDRAFLTLNRAFLFLRDGDTLYIGEGTFTLTRPLEWMGSIHITGKGCEKTIIQAGEKPVRDKGSVFTFSVMYNMKYTGCGREIPVSVIEGVTLQNGAAPAAEPSPTSVGGGIKNFAGLHIRNCIIQNNTAFNGGGIYNAGVLHLENSIIRNNHAHHLEGAVFNTPDAVYSHDGCVFNSNTQDLTCTSNTRE